MIENKHNHPLRKPTDEEIQIAEEKMINRYKELASTDEDGRVSKTAKRLLLYYSDPEILRKEALHRLSENSLQFGIDLTTPLPQIEMVDSPQEIAGRKKRSSFPDTPVEDFTNKLIDNEMQDLDDQNINLNQITGSKV